MQRGPRTEIDVEATQVRPGRIRAGLETGVGEVGRQVAVLDDHVARERRREAPVVGQCRLVAGVVEVAVPVVDVPRRGCVHDETLQAVGLVEADCDAGRFGEHGAVAAAAGLGAVGQAEEVRVVPLVREDAEVERLESLRPGDRRAGQGHGGSERSKAGVDGWIHRSRKSGWKIGRARPVPRRAVPLGEKLNAFAASRTSDGHDAMAHFVHRSKGCRRSDRSSAEVNRT